MTTQSDCAPRMGLVLGRVAVAAALVMMSAALVLTGCGMDAVVDRGAAEQAPGTVGPSFGAPTKQAVVGSLPQEVPVPPGGLVVSGPTSERRGSVAGWSAVVAVSPASSEDELRTWLRARFDQAGWQSKGFLVGRDKDQGLTLSGHRIVPHAGDVGAEKPTVASPIPSASVSALKEQWIQVFVTKPLTGSGPAVVYLFAEEST